MNDVKKKDLNYIIQTPHRGSASNQTGRFNKAQLIYDLSDLNYIDLADLPSLKTEFYQDHSKTIVTPNDSPDLGMGISLNSYRGCEHGCIYCYARPTHEYFNLSAGLDFESKIFVKENAAQLLRAEMMKLKWKPQAVMMSGVTDCYQPIERKLQLTRQCLKVCAEFKNPVVIITKNFLVTRDIDILSKMASEQLAVVCLSVTSLDEKLARLMEPRTAPPAQRLKAIQLLAEAGIPVTVNVAPVIPGLTDHEIPRILEAAAKAGAQSAWYVMLRLPHSVKDLFSEWLQVHYPQRKDKVLNAIRDVREGQLYDSDFAARMRGTGPRADHIEHMFKVFKQKYFRNKNISSLRTDLFTRPPQRGDQMSLFD